MILLIFLIFFRIASIFYGNFSRGCLWAGVDLIEIDLAGVDLTGG